MSVFYLFLVTTKAKYTFSMENSGSHHLNKMVKLSRINRGTTWHDVLSRWDARVCALHHCFGICAWNDLNIFKRQDTENGNSARQLPGQFSKVNNLKSNQPIKQTRKWTCEIMSYIERLKSHNKSLPHTHSIIGIHKCKYGWFLF